MIGNPWQKIRRGLRCPPRVLARRLTSEWHRAADRMFAWRRVATDVDGFLRSMGDSTLEASWERLASRSYIGHRQAERASLERWCEGEVERILAAAENGVERWVDLLGSGQVRLGRPIDWHRDYKTGLTWPLGLASDLDYTNPERPSDVKFPWELSRLQWLIPVGQAYLLTHDDRYAANARELLEEWIEANPYMYGVNWACTMEVALRIVSWTWLFHVFQASPAWSDPGFRGRFLSSLHDHACFTEHYLEYSDVNGNHCTADAAGLVFAGLFFGRGPNAQRWLHRGWRLLCEEIRRQVSEDGVDFEASVAYHRLVLELFLLPAWYRERLDMPTPPAYRDRIIQMARFVQAYSRPDGSVPYGGDADDGRMLPLGGQPLNDHRYLIGLVGAGWCVTDLQAGFSGSFSEVYWHLGSTVCDRLEKARHKAPRAISTAFPQGGFRVMRNERDHVFVDCGPVGFAGRGGHGHNDCLSFEAVLNGQPLVIDCGSYVYTASLRERNAFRSTAYHNTPQVDSAEINRFPANGSPWQLQADASPRVLQWRPGPHRDLFRGTHTGYLRLPSRICPVRTVVLDHRVHGLLIEDCFQPQNPNCSEVQIEVPLHLAPDVRVHVLGNEVILEATNTERFRLVWDGQGPWQLDIGQGRASPSYGRVLPIVRLAWRYRGPACTRLQVALGPEHAFDEGDGWIQEALRECG